MRKEKKNRLKWLFPLFIVFIMVFSVFEIMMGAGGNTTRYNGYKVKTLQDGFETTVGKLKIQSMYHPKQLEDIESPGLSALSLMGKQVALSFDPDDSNQMYTDYARYQLAKFFNDIQVSAVSAVSKEGGNYSLPVIDCSSSTENLTVMLFEQGNNTKITKEGNCYILKAASPQEIIMAEERFKFTIAGVMNVTSQQ